MRHDWPGNVRELRNVVAVALALASEGEELDIAAHLGALTEAPLAAPAGRRRGRRRPSRGRRSRTPSATCSPASSATTSRRSSDESKGNVSEMARRAGMERAHVRAYLRRHGIGAKHDPDEAQD